MLPRRRVLPPGSTGVVFVCAFTFAFGIEGVDRTAAQAVLRDAQGKVAAASESRAGPETASPEGDAIPVTPPAPIPSATRLGLRPACHRERPGQPPAPGRRDHSAPRRYLAPVPPR